MKNIYFAFSFVFLLMNFATTAQAQVGQWTRDQIPRHLMFKRMYFVNSGNVANRFGLSYLHAPVGNSDSVIEELHYLNPTKPELGFIDSSLLESLLYTVDCKHDVFAYVKSTTPTGSTSPTRPVYNTPVPFIVATALLTSDVPGAVNPLCATIQSQFGVPLETTTSIRTGTCTWGSKSCVKLNNVQITQALVWSISPSKDVLNLTLIIKGKIIIAGKESQFYAEYGFPDLGTRGVIDEADKPFLKHMEDVYTLVRAATAANSKFFTSIEIETPTVDALGDVGSGRYYYSGKLNFFGVERSR